MNPTISTKVVSFIGHGEDGSSIPFKLRLGTEDSANALNTAMERETALVRSESDM